MKLKLTTKIPTSPGFYYWTNFGEHTPTILKVVKQQNKLYAFNNEFSFEVKKLNRKKVIKESKSYHNTPIDGHYYGEELWAKIPELTINGKVINPECY